MRYPNHKDYADLYARYFKKGPEVLFGDHSLRDKMVADLCGGGGRLSFAAHARGANVTYVDAEERMIPTDELRRRGIAQECMTVREWCEKTIMYGHRYDFIFCQQAVNYWLYDKETDSIIADLVGQCLKPEGKFIFNTFNKAPPFVPRILTYEYLNWEFTEVSYLVGQMVHHAQFRQGIDPHITTFRWFDPEFLKTRLNYNFFAVEQRDGASSYWTCTKR